MHKHLLFFLAASAAGASLLAGCKENISSLGAQYFTDTVGIHTSIRNDTGFLRFADTLRPVVSFNGIDVALTDSTPRMIIGRVALGSENLESWGLIQFPSLTADTANMVTGIRLLLKDEQFKYGDTTNNTISLRVWTSYRTVFDSTAQISQSNLSSASVGTIDTTIADRTDSTLPIVLDTAAVKPLLTEAFNAFVITPGSSMTNARSFGTMHSWGDTNSIPKLMLTLNNGAVIYKKPILDFHLVHDMSTTPLGEFTLRGSTGRRERITLNLTRPTDSAHLDQFTSINNATLVLHLDPGNTRYSNLPGDTLAPVVVKLGTTDAADFLDVMGAKDAADPTKYLFQIRGLVEQWLRYPSQNLGFELRVAFAQRNFGGGSASSIGVEDSTINRLTFYGPDYPDATKRPYIILSYSNLH